MGTKKKIWYVPYEVNNCIVLTFSTKFIIKVYYIIFLYLAEMFMLILKPKVIKKKKMNNLYQHKSYRNIIKSLWVTKFIE